MPSVMLDNASDFVPAPPKPSAPISIMRTLLLSPPSLSSHPERLDNVLAAHDRISTDMQMLDRLSMSLVSLPAATYDLILVLTDADDTRKESKRLLSKDVLGRIVKALKPGGKLQSQDGSFGCNDEGERREAIFAGLVVENDEVMKPLHSDTQSVPLRSNKAQNIRAATNAVGTGAVTLNINGERQNGPPETNQPAGVGFVNFNDDFETTQNEDGNSDNDLIDENTLLDEEDMKRPVVQPPECRPKTGKRRRACKDCTCGLAQKIEAEDRAKRFNADSQLAKLKADDLAEVDFTVQGKVGSCGNCALGDAFRCDGCPYIGLPAFKPGEDVRLVNDEVQL